MWGLGLSIDGGRDYRVQRRFTGLTWFGFVEIEG